MCGIAGLLAFDGLGAPVAEATLAAMRETMVHRGPDGAGTWVADDRRIGLAHRRLAIIDLSAAAAQPMLSADGRLAVSFNGEIYNHRELRRELVALGHRDWRTDHSDTEVILAAYREWGTDCLERFRGMFAFALWDAAERALWLVRDRIGIKPLYYALDDDGVVFASEIKAILAGPARRRAVDEEAFYHFLSFLTSPGPSTLFAGIDKLAAGTWMRVWADGRIERRRWWDALDHAPDLGGLSEAEAAERLLAELRVAVDYRKEADVPLGVFLSGGVDSSTNLALFAEGEQRPVRTFSIGYAGDPSSVPDELPFARMMAERVGAEHHERKLTEDDLLGFLPRMIELQDEPIADPVCVPVYFVSKLARDAGVVVCQVGEGADELFCGYPRWGAYLGLERANALPVPRALKRAGVRLLEAAGRGDRTSTELLRRAGAGRPIFWGGAEAFTDAEKRRLLSPRLRDRFRGVSSWEAVEPIRRRFEAKARGPAPLDWMTYLDLNMRLPELLLMRVDKMSMGTSVEARVPFLDHEFVSLVLGIPATTRMPGSNLKHLLKTAVRGVIPDAVIDRKKQGFAVPVNEWGLGRMGEHAGDMLRQFCRETDFFDPAAVDAWVRRGDRSQVWYLLNFALWWRAYVKA